jgi:hypothetical protein
LYYKTNPTGGDRMKKFIVLSSLLLLLNCAQNIVKLDKQIPGVSKKINKTYNYYIWGLYPREYDVDIKDICGEKDRLTEIKSMHGVIDWFLIFFTLAFYRPVSLEITCITPDEK